MTDEKKPEMTARRMEEIRKLAEDVVAGEQAVSPGVRTVAEALAADVVPELLSALEEAQRVSDARFRVGRRALEMSRKASTERDALAARVAELEGALAGARSEALREAAGACRAYASACRALMDDAEHDAEVEALKADAAESLAKEIEAMKAAAPPEKAPGAVGPDGTARPGTPCYGCPKEGRCLSDSAPCIRSTEWEAYRTTIGRPVMVHCSPRVAERAAELVDDRTENGPDGKPFYVHGPECEGACDYGCSGRFVEPGPADAAPPADPLCARDLGDGRKCGHPLGGHGPHCRQMIQAPTSGHAVPCPCPGFVPEPQAVRDAARSVLQEIGAALDAADARPSAPSGMGDGGTARTCETCKHKKPLGVGVRHFADVGFSGVCDPDDTGGDGFVRDSEACSQRPPRWSPKAGGSTTEGGETP